MSDRENVMSAKSLLYCKSSIFRQNGEKFRPAKIYSVIVSLQWNGSLFEGRFVGVCLGGVSSPEHHHHSGHEEEIADEEADERQRQVGVHHDVAVAFAEAARGVPLMRYAVALAPLKCELRM